MFFLFLINYSKNKLHQGYFLQPLFLGVFPPSKYMCKRGVKNSRQIIWGDVDQYSKHIKCRGCESYIGICLEKIEITIM